MAVQPRSYPSSDPDRSFVGREREMASLRPALEAAQAGEGGLVILSGEAGIGKTRLAEVVVEEARGREMLVSWGRCWEAGGAPAYWPWLQVLRSALRNLEDPVVDLAFGARARQIARVLPELEGRYAVATAEDVSVEETEAVRFELYTAIAGAIRDVAGARPTLIVLEDLHSADEPSLLLLRFVANELSDAPVLLLATYRAGELSWDDPRMALLADLTRQAGAIHVVPRGLSEQAVRTYVTGTLGRTVPPDLVDLVHRETEGNPLFVTEVVRMLADEHRATRISRADRPQLEIPESIRAVISRRLARLSGPCRQLLDEAAVAGVEFPLDVLVADAESDSDEVLELLDEAARLEVLVAPARPGGIWQFRHTLYREVIYHALGARARMRLHLGVARTLERMHEAALDPPVAELAHHYLHAVPAADPGTAVHYARRAGEQASLRSAHEEAERLYRSALSVVDHGTGTYVDLLIRLGEAADRAGDLAAGRAADLEAATIAEQLGLVEQFARAAVAYGGRFVWLRAGTDDVLIPLLERALAALGDADSHLRVRLLARLAGALRSDPSTERRAVLSSEAVAMARRMDDPVALEFALVGRYFAIAGPDTIDEVERVAAEAQRVTAMTGDRERISDVHCLMYDLLSTTGAERSAIRAEIDRYGRLAAELRQPSLTFYQSALRTIMVVDEGRLEEGEALVEEVARLGARTLERDAFVSRLMCMFMIRREQARLEEVADQIRSAVQELPDYRFFECLQAYLDAETGRIDDAQAALDRLARDDFSYLPRDMGWLFGMTYLAEAAVRIGDRRGALAIERLLVPYRHLFAVATSEVNSGPISRPLGLIAGLDGRIDAAVDLLGSAREACAVTGIRTFELRTMVEAAELLRQRGRPGDDARALQLATGASTMASELGLVDTAERADRLVAFVQGSEPLVASAVRARRPVGDRAEQRATSLRRDGETWQVGRDRIFHLRHSKGLAYLAMLLASPGREYHVLDLVHADGAPVDGQMKQIDAVGPGLQDAAGPIPEAGLDATARAAYRERLQRLEHDGVEAEASGDREAMTRIRWEMDVITHELKAAYGLGGRARPTGAAAERARQSVTKALRHAIRRIGDLDASIGSHLQASIRTGIYCTYAPDPTAIHEWVIEDLSRQPAGRTRPLPDA